MKDRILSRRTNAQLDIGGRLAASRGYLSSSEILKLDERAEFEAKWVEAGFDLKGEFIQYAHISPEEEQEEGLRSADLFRDVPGGLGFPEEYNVVIEDPQGLHVILVKDGQETMRCRKCGGPVVGGHICRTGTIYPISLQ